MGVATGHGTDRLVGKAGILGMVVAWTTEGRGIGSQPQSSRLEVSPGAQVGVRRSQADMTGTGGRVQWLADVQNRIETYEVEEYDDRQVPTMGGGHACVLRGKKDREEKEREGRG